MPAQPTRPTSKPPTPHTNSTPEKAGSSHRANGKDQRDSDATPAKVADRVGGLPEIVQFDPSEPRYFNRDLSWLEFNRRVLAQAGDDRVPLLERVRFLGIFTSNLDEFFMKRVGLIKRQVHAGVDVASPDGLSPRQQLSAVRDAVVDLVAEQRQIWELQVQPSLVAEGIHVLRYTDLPRKDQDWVNDWYRQHVFAALTPLAVDPTHKFPFISNLSDSIAVIASAESLETRDLARRSFPKMKDTGEFQPERDQLFARLKIPPGIKRFIALPNRGADRAAASSVGGSSGSASDGHRFVLLQDVVRHSLSDLFPGMQIEDNLGFRVTRSSGIQKDDLDTGNLLQSIEADLKQRRFARSVRLEIEPDPPASLLRWLLNKLNLDPQDVYERPGGVDFAAVDELCDIDRPDLKYKPYRPAIPARLAPAVLQPSAEKAASQFFAAIRKQDILVHHPYESFSASVEKFIACAASDPDVITIKQTLYRSSPDSPFIENLVRAAEQGKQVACLVELRARFDEGRNVRFARQLEKAGVHVAYGVAGLKTHCKTSLVVRRERHGLRCYAHMGTGNYHPKTAQLYTDVGLMTCDPQITNDLVNLFNFLTGLAATQTYSSLLVAPFTMRQRFNQMIDREIQNAKKGRPARIIAKINSMEDRETTDRLYAASQAGVQVTLIVRGFCGLRPGVPGLSENIRVISVVGRYLEHSRIFHFAAGQDDPLGGDWYIGSADWMYRNLSNRVEVATPVYDRDARARLAQIFDVHMQDHVNAWDLKPGGTYARRASTIDALPDSPASLGTFETLMRAAQTL
jgi:polyphosphate kinase